MTKTKIVISLLLLSFTHAQAANIDFNAIYNNALEACSDNQTSKDCKRMKEPNSECDSTTSKYGVAGNETSTNKPCANVKSDNYVEPRFSTKRPRGQ